ncbi:MAG: hypothetical protein WCF84_22060 [Anaerolineae bacterium]
MKRSKPTASAAAMKRFQELERTLGHDTWERRIKRLAAEMIAQHEGETIESSLHQEVEELLPLYVPDELVGIDVVRRYPLVARHLAYCSECHTAYAMLKAALNEVVPQAPGIAAASETQAWRRVEIPGSLKRQGVKFVIDSNFLRTRYTQAVMLRGRGGGEREVLILGDQILVDKQPIVVETWLAPSAVGKERFDLRIVLKASPALARRAHILLDCGKHHAESRFKQGEAYFSRVSLTDIKVDVSLTIELVPYDRSRHA